MIEIYNLNLDEKTKIKIISKSVINKKSGCIEWTGAKNHRKYGYINTGVKNKSVHRIVAAAKYGDIPNGLVVCHKCDNPSCVNPDHLFIGTQKENVQDCMNKGRWPKKVGKLPWNTKLNESNVREIRLRANNGESKIKLAAEFGVSTSSVKDLVSRKTWSNVS